jgi:hypothetical protein
MKAERRHELRENALARQAVKAVKVMQLPDLRRKWLSRAAVALIVVLVITALVYNRVTASSNAHAQARELLARASQLTTQIRLDTAGPNVPLDARFFDTMTALSEEAGSDLEQVMANSSDPQLLAQAAVLRGDINYTLANVPVLPSPTTAASQPAPSLKLSRDEYLSRAASAYKDVADHYKDQPISYASARFGLAAVAENKSEWQTAKSEYEAVLADPNSAPSIRQRAQQGITNLAQLQHAPLLERTPVPPLVLPTTNPTTQAATQPATRPAS